MLEQTREMLARELAHSRLLTAQRDLAVDGAELAWWSYRIDTGAAQWNNRWFHLLGFLPGDWPCHFSTWEQLLHPDDLPIAQKALADHLSGQTPIYECKVRMRHRLGQWVWVYTRGQVVDRTESGLPLVVAGIHMDISQTVAYEQEALRQQNQLREMFDSMDRGMAVFNTEELVYCNHRFTQMLGYAHPPNALLGMALQQLLTAVDWEDCDSQRKQVLDGQRAHPLLLHLLHHSGCTVPVIWTWLAVNWHGCTHALGMVQSIPKAELLPSEQDASHEHYSRLLVSQLEAQQHHIARELHDSLGSELTGVSLMLANIKNCTANHSLSSKDLQQALDKVLFQISHVANITRALAHGLAPIEDLPEGLFRALEQLSRTMSQPGLVRCETQLDAAGIPSRPEFSTHLYRIAQEALTNALRHGNATHMRIVLARSGIQGQLSVHDNGTGFNAQDALQKNTAGMGIHSMRARARNIRAQLNFEPSPLGGTCVFVRYNLD